MIDKIKKVSEKDIKSRFKRIAIITEILLNIGGIEKCVLTLTKGLEAKGIKGDIYAGLYNPEKTFPEFKELNIRSFRKDRLPSFLNTLYLRWKFRNLKLRGYDGYVFYCHHTVAAGRNNHPNVWWSTGPLSYLYGLQGRGPDNSLRHMYGKNLWKKYLIKVYLYFLRLIDQSDIKGVDNILVLHDIPKRKLHNAYPNRIFNMVVSPVDTTKFKYISKGKYYLSLARLSPDKYVNKIVEAFQKMLDKELYIVGTGPDKDKIIEMSKGYNNIKFLGYVSENELSKLIGNSIAMISAESNEGFSMNLIEALACGKPGIYVDNSDISTKKLVEDIASGKRTNINDNKINIKSISTGVLMSIAKPEAIIKAVKYLTPEKAEKMRKACEERSKMYSKENYVNNILNELYEISKINS